MLAKNVLRRVVCHSDHLCGIVTKKKGILEFAVAHDLVMANTYFKKKDGLFITFVSGMAKMHVNFKVLRRNDLENILDCKVVLGVASPNRRLCFSNCARLPNVSGLKV